MIKDYNDFCTELLKAGFSLAHGNNENVFGLIEYGWNEEPSDSPIRWHTGDRDRDPWEWRIRVLNERDDVAYAKVFFCKAGYITKECYPYFLAARRCGKSFMDEYLDGNISNYAKRIYEVISENGSLPLHEIKQIARFKREDNSKFDRALTELQMKLYITMCGEQQKISKKGESYGWSSMVFCTTESFWGEEVFKQAQKISQEEAVQAIRERVYTLNPLAQEKKVIKFING